MRVCCAICKNLQDNIPKLTILILQRIAFDFNVKANFLHSIGAIDWKHIHMCNTANCCGLKLQIYFCRHSCLW